MTNPVDTPSLASESLSLLTRAPMFAWASLLLAPSFMWGVPAGEVAWSADMVCMLRAIGSQHPDPKLRNPDHLAQRLCPRPFELRDYPSARSEIDAAPETWAGFFYVNARTHHIDAIVQGALREGVTQVVILGSGFDSRAYRFHSAHPAVRFFELDLPETIAAKKRRLRQAFICLHAQVTLAPIDFDRQSLDEVLPPLGYDTRRKTLFILEGVTMYISEAGTAATLAFVRRHAARGSRIVFDYLLREALAAEGSRFHGMEWAAAMLVERGEPFITGWTQREAAALAKAHGLEPADDLGSADLARHYLIGSDGRPDGQMLEGSRILEARLPGKA